MQLGLHKAQRLEVNIRLIGLHYVRMLIQCTEIEEVEETKEVEEVEEAETTSKFGCGTFRM